MGGTSRPPVRRRAMQILDPQLFWPIVGAIVAGAVIGSEREYRAARQVCERIYW